MGALTRIAAVTRVRVAAVCVVVGAGAVVGLLVLGASVSAPAIGPTVPVEAYTILHVKVPRNQLHYQL